MDWYVDKASLGGRLPQIFIPKYQVINLYRAFNSFWNLGQSSQVKPPSFALLRSNFQRLSKIFPLTGGGEIKHDQDYYSNILLDSGTNFCPN